MCKDVLLQVKEKHNASGEQRRPDNSDGGTGKHKPAQKWEPLQAFSAAQPFRKLSTTTWPDTSYLNTGRGAFFVDIILLKKFCQVKKMDL
ncbi:uncharacterized protein LOC116415050 isoform X2 [Apis florea]|uniref:uncharacterized protein LOC116415050 isoform X2 n=1 Tax=Apis florea TaxID=7463 RepID=UPI0012FED0A3|nr:uncharacterized protein LOC116415050 isoform X2 [Apis florea]